MEYIELNSSCADSEASLRLEAKSEGDEALSSEGCGSSVGIGESLSTTAGSGSGRFFPLSRTFSAWCAGGPPAAGCGGSGGIRDGLSADRMGVVVEVVVVAATVLLEAARLPPRLAAAAAAAAAAA